MPSPHFWRSGHDRRRKLLWGKVELCVDHCAKWAQKVGAVVCLAQWSDAGRHVAARGLYKAADATPGSGFSARK